MLDFFIWDENLSLISLTEQGCSMVWRQNAITLTLAAGNGIDFSWIWTSVNELVTAF